MVTVPLLVALAHGMRRQQTGQITRWVQPTKYGVLVLVRSAALLVLLVLMAHKRFWVWLSQQLVIQFKMVQRVALFWAMVLLARHLMYLLVRPLFLPILAAQANLQKTARVLYCCQVRIHLQIQVTSITMLMRVRCNLVMLRHWVMRIIIGMLQAQHQFLT